MDYFTYFVSAKKVTSEKHSELVTNLHQVKIVPPCQDMSAKTLGDLYSKASTSNSYKDFSDHLLRALLNHVLETFDVFLSENRKMQDLELLPHAFSDFIRKYAIQYEKKGEKKTDYNLAYLQIPAAKDR